MRYEGLSKRELREKLVRSDNAIAAQLSDKKHYQALYYEYLERYNELLERHNRLYIQSLNRGYKDGQQNPRDTRAQHHRP